MKLRTKFQDEDFRLGEEVEVRIYLTKDGSIVVYATGENSEGTHVIRYPDEEAFYDNWEEVDM